jgi:hypothetical protein
MNFGRLLALALAFALLGMYLLSGIGVPEASIRGLLAVLIIPFLFLLVSHGPGEVCHAALDALSRDHSATPVERFETGIAALEALGRYSLAAGVLGTLWAILAALTGAAQMGATVSPLSMAPLLSQAFLLPAVGAFLCWFVYAPLAASLRNAWSDPEAPTDAG